MSVVLATAGFDHKIRFWEAPSGICSRIIKFPDSQVNRLEITPDKQFIAAAGNPVIRLYEILDSTTPATSHNAGAGTGGHAAGGGGGDPHHHPHHHHQQQQPQQAVLTLEGHTSNVTSIGFQKDGRYLYSGSEDGTIKIWDLRNPNYSRSFSVGAAVNSVTLRSDRDEFISGDQDGFVKIWNLGGSGCINSIKPSLSSSSGKSGGGGSSSDSVSRSSGGGGRPRRNNYSYVEEGTAIQAVDISEDSRTLVAVSNHGTVFVWDPSTSTTTFSDSHEAEDQNGHLSSTATSALLRPVTKFRAHAVGSYALHAKIAPDCRHLVTCASDGTSKLWDTTTWELAQTLHNKKNHSGTNGTENHGNGLNTRFIWDAAFCADSSYLVTASSDQVSRLWNLRTGDVVRQYHGHQSAVTCVALNDSSV